jgi:hypothetical protein
MHGEQTIQKVLTHSGLQLERRSISGCADYQLLQKGNAMSFVDAYCEWRNTRGLRVQGQAGFIAKRKHQRRPRQADAFLLSPSVPRFDHLVSVPA